MKDEKELEVNMLQIIALTHSVIMEIKHGHPLARNTVWLKRQIKEFFGLPNNANNYRLLGAISHIYEQAGELDKFKKTIAKFNIILFDFDLNSPDE